MKTVEEFCKEIARSKELQDELKNAWDETLKAFLTKHGCEADVEKFLQLASESSEGEIEDEDVASIAGGGGVYSRPGKHRKVTPVL